MSVAPTESTLHANSAYGSVGGAGTTEETSAIATRWLYTSFIEAPNEKDSNGTGIGLGTNTGFSEGGADVITFVTGGTVEAKVTGTGIETDDITSISDNTDLNLSANGTGSVYVNDTLKLSGNITKGTGTITVPNNTTGTMVLSVSDTTGQTGVNQTLSAAGNISATVDGLGTASNVEFGQVKTTDITTGASSTAGSFTGNWSLTAGSRMQATYADLAEYYEGDVEYAVGTVLVFGGDKDVTQSTEHRTTRVAGVVSDQSAYTMNEGCPGIKILTALQGKVPVNVIGKVAKGDMLVASAIPGYAIVDNDPKVGSVIGKAIGTKDTTEKGTVEVVVGRV
jgi:hypothetical protein